MTRKLSGDRLERHLALRRSNRKAESRSARAKRLRRWRARNPEKTKAHNIVAGALRTGKLVKPKACQRCRQVSRLEGHHRDYSKPLEVEWLCYWCHHGVPSRRDPVEIDPNYLRYGNSSGFSGVDFRADCGKWRATIRLNGKKCHLGLFASPEQAHTAYLKAYEHKKMMETKRKQSTSSQPCGPFHANCYCD